MVQPLAQSIIMSASIKKCIYLVFLLYLFITCVSACGYPGSPAHANIKFNPDNRENSGTYQAGTIALYTCDNGYDLLGPSRRTCYNNGTWLPPGVPFCVLNVAVGKAAMQSSGMPQGTAQRAVDGNTSERHNNGTCTITDAQPSPWWYVNLLEPYQVQLVRIDFGLGCCGQNEPAVVTVRVGNYRPDMKKNVVCNKFVGYIEGGAPLYLPCAKPTLGAFVSVHIESQTGRPIRLSICETFVYTDAALSIEQCPSFRDTQPGSTATYNGKCYTFYNDQVQTFENARRFCEHRGGTLVDDATPALQGFLSWELYRKHRTDRDGQYWLGAVRDANNLRNWKWLNGKDVTISFWTQNARGIGNCSRLDGTRGWMWDITSCEGKLHFVCQLRPLTCGRPEIPANSTILYRKLDIGSQIEYRCSPGTQLIGPNIRTCVETGFFNDRPPKCKYLECGSPASISNGDYTFLNGTRSFQSIVQYSCRDGYTIVGRSALSCDVDSRWNGPPPHCQPIECGRPPIIENAIINYQINSTIVGSRVAYSCLNEFELEGDPVMICGKNGFWEGNQPICKSKPSTTLRTTTTTTSTTSSTTRPPTRRINPTRGHLPPSVINQPRRPDVYTTSTHRPSTSRTNQYTRFSSKPSSSSYPSPSMPSFPPSSPSSSSSSSSSSASPSPPSSVHTTSTTSSPTSSTGHRSTSTINSKRPYNNGGVYNSDEDEDNTIPDSLMVSRSNVKTTASAKLNMGGIIALGVFGGFVFLAAITTIIIIIFRRLRNSRSSIDAQTISTFDSSGDQNGFYRNYKESWENLKYVRHNTSYKPNMNRLDAFDTGFGHPRAQRGISNEGFRDLNEITLNAEVAGLYSRPEKQGRHGRR